MEVTVNSKHLKARLVKSGYIDTNFELKKESLINLLNKRFDEIDFAEAKKDVEPFIMNINKLDLWSKGFFKEFFPALEINS